MPPLGLRDRDAILTAEGLIFRVYGYWHPPEGYVCDPEYAPSTIFRSGSPKALRQGKEGVYYKFYGDEGLNFVRKAFPKYMLYHRALGQRLVGVPISLIGSVRKPQVCLRRLLEAEPMDALLERLAEVLEILSQRSSLRPEDLGVFGSLLHGFYHPQHSDLDLVVIGERALRELLEALQTLYGEGEGRALRNEFEESPQKPWRFKNFPYEAYLWHQRRKLIYGVLLGKAGKRDVKVELEPLKAYGEALNEYALDLEIAREGWIRAEGRVIGDRGAPYMPSVYEVELDRVLEGPRYANVVRIVSYVEEFRMQAQAGERVYMEGWLERVLRPGRTFHQVTLTYGPKYYEQALFVPR